MDELPEVVLDEVDLLFVVNDEFKGFQITVWREEREVSPKDVNNRAGVNCRRGGVR